MTSRSPADLRRLYTPVDRIAADRAENAVVVRDPSTAIVVGDRVLRQDALARLAFPLPMYVPRVGKTTVTVRFGDEDGSFPAGFAPRIAADLGLPLVGWPGGVGWSRPRGTVAYRFSPAVTLRPDQEAALAAALTYERGLIVMPTGAGKTVVAAAIIAAFGVPTVVFVPTLDLLAQTARRLSELVGVTPGIIGGGTVDVRPLTVALIPAVARKLDDAADDLRSFALAIVDEAHHARASTVRALLCACTNAGYRFGLTATPRTERGDDFLVESAIGAIISEATLGDAIARGVLIGARVIALSVPAEPDLSAYPPEPFAPLYTAGITENAPRTAALAAVAAQLARDVGPTLVIAREIAHGEALRAAIAAAGVDVRFISGADASDVRARALADLGSGRLPCLVATTILDEGVDVPAIAAVVLAAGGRAAHKTIQRVGRGLRPGRDQRELVVVDVLDRAHPVLTFHAQRRFALYRRLGWPITPLSV